MNTEKHIHYWPNTTQLTKPAKEVAKILGVHPNTLFRWVKAGKICCRRFSRNSVYVTYNDVMQFIEDNEYQIKLNI
jgi:excisionase family DNA binding protein